MYILKSQTHSHSRCFESQQSSSGKPSTDLFSNKYQSSAERTKGIKSDVLLSQTDTPTIPEKIPATVVPPEISCRSHLHDGHLVVIDEASRILKFWWLRSLLDKIGWRRDKPLVIDCNGQVATINHAMQRLLRQWRILGQIGWRQDEPTVTNVNCNNWRVKASAKGNTSNSYHSLTKSTNRRHYYFIWGVVDDGKEKTNHILSNKNVVEGSQVTVLWRWWWKWKEGRYQSINKCTGHVTNTNAKTCKLKGELFDKFFIVFYFLIH